MKIKIIFSVMLLVLAGIAMQSCKKEAPVNPTPVLAAVPDVPVPSIGTVIAFTGANQAVNLSWQGTADNPSTWSVYFGTSEQSSNPLVATVTGNSYTAHIGTIGGTYYWQVVTTDANNITTRSPRWKFTVNSAPNVPALTAPANNATGVNPTTAALTWTSTDPENDNLSYDVYFGTTATPGLVATKVTDKTYKPTMSPNTTYYWKIVAKDPSGGITSSAVNTFKTDVLHPDFSVFKGIYTELCPSISATRLIDVFLSVNTTTHVITMYLPVANAMLAAGFGTSIVGLHPIFISYDPVALTVSSTNQLLLDSFPDPIEQGPMYVQVASGTIDPTNKKLLIKWIITPSTPEFGGVFNTSTTTYTLRVQK